MNGLDPQEFERSLKETAAWCAAQPLNPRLWDPAEMQHRKELNAQAVQLLKVARTKANGGVFRRPIRDLSEFKQATQLLLDIRNSLGPLKSVLRSDALKPDFDLDRISENFLWDRAVAQVIAKRSSQVNQSFAVGRKSTPEVGRLLLYYPHDNLADGAADFSSNGFFDSDNVPPWDIWVGFSDGALLSWVPPELIEAADMGIDANPEECIRWAR